MLCRYQDPFEEYKSRQEKKRAKQAAAQEPSAQKAAEKKAEDEINWFGVKLGSNAPGANGASGGVGKYLNGVAASSLKRPAEALVASPGAPEEGKKKRRIGFGNFDAW